ncbi:hypothetical protein [Streptomyces sp. NPDC050485]|uniref:hypothetical protein n=1 Tax=Streptomyces sp. NPDC050485 TaxID=3365617 RepID=UPI0037AE5E59
MLKGMRGVRRPARGGLLSVLVVLAWAGTACAHGDVPLAGAPPQSPSAAAVTPTGTAGAGSSTGSASPSGAMPSAPAKPSSTAPEPSPDSTPPPPATAPAAHPECVAGAVTVTLRSPDSAVQRLCVRVGATVTAVVPPGPGGAWPGPWTSSPMLATIAAKSADPDGTGRVTIRAARPGAATVTWGTRGAAALTLHLDVAAYQIP